MQLQLQMLARARSRKGWKSAKQKMFASFGRWEMLPFFPPLRNVQVAQDINCTGQRSLEVVSNQQMADKSEKIANSPQA